VNTPTNARYVLQRSNTSTAIMSPQGPTGKRGSLTGPFPHLKANLSPQLAPFSSPIPEDDRSVRSVFQAYHGGVRPSAVDGPGVYYLGIVDMLQRYTWKKQAERWLKSLFKPINGISSCSPVEYAERFQRRVAGQIIEEYDSRMQGQWGGSTTPPHVPQLRRHSSLRK
jgi:Phosphatidylinositol-4-phosphate 5-Kinase